MAIALERLTDLGEPVQDPYLVAALDTDLFLERRLSALDSGTPRRPIRTSGRRS